MEEPRLVHLTFVMESSDVEKLAQLNCAGEADPEYLVRLCCVDQQLHGYPVDANSLKGEIHDLLEQRNRLEATITSLRRWLDGLLARYATRLTRASMSSQSHARDVRRYLD